VDPKLDPDVRFYILGLSPNNARLAVRFWNVSTFGGLMERIGQHFRDMSMEVQFQRDPEYPAFWQLVLEAAPLRKSENVPPLLAGALTRSILTGLPYPQSFFTAVLGRIRADRVVNYLRAAILKACLVRNDRMEVPMSLDCERRDPAYRLGRLFALLELRLGQHHINKAEYGGYTDKLIAEVVDGIDRLPKQLSLQDQGIFTIGYYHQRNALYRKCEKERGHE
jgi:CRISPR-associated protein Csd1